MSGLQVHIEGAQPGAFNMQRDRDLVSLTVSGEAHLRIYTWQEVWVTLGRFQTPETAFLNPELAPPFSIRPTGGGAVLHGHDLTLGLAVPLERLGLSSREAKSIYRGLVAPLVSAFQNLGRSALLGDQTERALAKMEPYCFSGIGGSDVLDADSLSKQAGCALRIYPAVALMQVSIPMRPPAIHPAELFIGAPKSEPLPPLGEAELTEAVSRAYRLAFDK